MGGWRLLLTLVSPLSPRNVGHWGNACGPPFWMGTPLQQLPKPKVELDGWIKGHQLGLCLKIFKICLNLSLSTENSSFQCRDVFFLSMYFHDFVWFFCILVTLGNYSHSRFWAPNTKALHSCSALLEGKERSTSITIVSIVSGLIEFFWCKLWQLKKLRTCLRMYIFKCLYCFELGIDEGMLVIRMSFGSSKK